MKRIVCSVSMLGLGSALFAGQASDDFVAAARVAYVGDDGCHISIVTNRVKDGQWDDRNPGNTVRWFEVAGARNVRDIGGWTGLRTGRIFRGTELGKTRRANGTSHGYDELTEAGIKTLREQMGINTDFDLRGKTKDARGQVITASPIGKDIRLITHPIGAYMDPFTYNGEKTYGAAMRDFARPEIYPVYMHCAGGADRTGTLCFLLETLCGVSLVDARIDYELTSFGLGARWSSRESVQPFATMVRTLSTYPGRTFQEKVAYFVEKVLLLTPAEIAAIRANLMVPTPERSSATAAFR